MTERAPQFRPETLVGIDAVKRALAIAGRGAGDATTKEGRDIVTTADVAVEDAVRGLIAEALKLPVVGEERGGEAPDGAPYWLVDPICGTRNFASSIPLYSVNLALVERGEVTAAVVGDPSTGEIDVAERGQGAWSLRDGARRRLNASDENLIVVVEDGKATGRRREQAARFSSAIIEADHWHFRSLGTTLASPYLAAGRIAAYVVFWVTAIHSAAGSLLITEAGGTISDIDGRPWTIRSDSFAGAASAHLHGGLLELLISGRPGARGATVSGSGPAKRARSARRSRGRR